MNEVKVLCLIARNNIMPYKVSFYEYGEQVMIITEFDNEVLEKRVQFITDLKNRNAMLFEYIEQALTFQGAEMIHVEDNEVTLEWLNAELDNDADNYPLTLKAISEMM